MSAAANDTSNDDVGNNAREQVPTETEQEVPETQPVMAADPTAVMQAALANFDGLRVDAAIQVQLQKTDFLRSDHK